MSQLDKTHILIVDDSQTIRNTLSMYIGDEYIVLHADNGEQAWELIKSNSSITLVFADLHMPVMNGMALLNRIRRTKHVRVKNLPVIMITGHADTEAAKRASYNMGASDFIRKPFSELDIISRVNAYVKLSKKIAKLEENATHDELTGLLNKQGFVQSGDHALIESMSQRSDLSLLCLQLGGLEEILKKYGKKITSQVIVSISNTIKKSLRKEECIAHLGMGQFSILFPSTKIFRSKIVSQRFKKTISNLMFKVGDQEIRLDISLGLNSTEKYTYEVSFDELFRHAEQAMQVSFNKNSLNLVIHENEANSTCSSQLTDGNSLDVISENLPLVKNDPSIDPELMSDNFKFINSAVFSRYMSLILNGDFNKIPKQDIKILLQPLKSFMEFVEEQNVVSETH